ncbi:hypothetical protein [Roseiarcus fermentans]|uniref:hypothetical protein n=1 Tax=Roseiarcus fermentans TaxID=1473586 RepID=UPI0011BE3ADF|nr:hypothetical protein [Roseiarcus fermentans]
MEMLAHAMSAGGVRNRPGLGCGGCNRIARDFAERNVGDRDSGTTLEKLDRDSRFRFRLQPGYDEKIRVVDRFGAPNLATLTGPAGQGDGARPRVGPCDPLDPANRGSSIDASFADCLKVALAVSRRRPDALIVRRDRLARRRRGGQTETDESGEPDGLHVPTPPDRP